MGKYNPGHYIYGEEVGQIYHAEGFLTTDKKFWTTISADSLKQITQGSQQALPIDQRVNIPKNRSFPPIASSESKLEYASMKIILDAISSKDKT